MNILRVPSSHSIRRCKVMSAQASYRRRHDGSKTTFRITPASVPLLLVVWGLPATACLYIGAMSVALDRQPWTAVLVALLGVLHFKHLFKLLNNSQGTRRLVVSADGISVDK